MMLATQPSMSSWPRSLSLMLTSETPPMPPVSTAREAGGEASERTRARREERRLLKESRELLKAERNAAAPHPHAAEGGAAPLHGLELPGMVAGMELPLPPAGPF